MTKPATEVELAFDEAYDADIADDDYVFVIGPNGELKQVILPDDLPFESPKNVSKILKMFKIWDIELLDGNDTIH